jgi:predicted transposase YbfD/YdcC
MIDDISDMPCSREQVSSFVDLLKSELPDPRDNRGKKHSLVFVIAAFVIATLVGRQKLSNIHRFICNRLKWLHTLTEIPKGRAISRAHLPRLLARLDWPILDKLIEKCFGIRIENTDGQLWVAVDGKVFRGSQHAGDKQSLVLAVTHETREVVGQAQQIGSKSSEIPVVRTLLKESGLEKQKISLDAHHCNPKTTAQIHQAGGVYLTQIKNNQPVLLQECKDLIESQQCMAETIEHNKANGRVTTRRARIFPANRTALNSRWKNSGINVYVIMERETFTVATKKTSSETSYYMSNHSIHAVTPRITAMELAKAIRKHWGVESGNWVRDVTFNEDKIKIKSGNQAQIMGRLRGLAIALLQKVSPKNIQAAIDKFSDSVFELESMLSQVKFL